MGCETIRKGEGERTWFRCSRVFRLNGQYFIATREGIDVGPYDSEQEAAVEAERLVAILAQVVNPIQALIVIREFRDRPRHSAPLALLAM